MNMKKLLMVGMVALFALAGAGAVFAEEYKLFYTGSWQGSITVTKDTRGKITIIPRVTNEYKVEDSWHGVNLTHSQCPLVPERKEIYIVDASREIVIDGNTTTKTLSDGIWYKTVVEGNTTTETWSNGHSFKEVVEGNTTTTIYPDGDSFWAKTVVDGNTTTETREGGSWKKIVVERNTTTKTWSDGRWEKTVVEGNTTIRSMDKYPAQMTVVDRQGYNIYIFTTTANHSIRSGNAHYNQKNYDQAIADYTQAIRLDPDKASAYRGRGSAYNAQKNYDRAIADFTEAIRLNPQYDYAYSMRGYVYALKRDYRNAIPDYEAALRINPNLTSTRNNLESAQKQVR